MNHFLKLRKYLKPYRLESVLALVVLTAVVVMDLAIPRLVQRIIDDGISAKNMQVVLSTTAIMLGISVLSALCAIGNNILSVRVGEGFARDLREAAFLRIQSFSFGNFDRLKTGQLIVRLTSDVSVAQRMVRIFLRIGTRAPLLMIGSLILMVNTSSRLALVMLPLLLVTSIIVTIYVSKIGSLFLTVQQKLDRLNNVLQENISGVRVVKAFVRGEHEDQRFEAANEDYTARSVKVMQTMATLSPLLMSLVNVGVVIVVWAGGVQAINGTLTVGEIVAFTNYLLTTMGPLTMFAHLSQMIAWADTSAGRINEVLEEEPEVQDVPDAQMLPERQGAQVRFEGVAFRYNGSLDETVLDGIHLSAEPGETVAILGATGSGKSTLVNLVPRFYDASGGRVLVNGVDVRDLQQDSLLAHVGIVPQETVLFSGTVRDNIRYGHPEASDEEVIAAAKAAQAHDFILELPHGYDTHVEQRGMNLSGGQKQRIAIARALLVQPAILILDDSTSSVDVETETHIQSALDDVLQGSTRLVVAQRISTVLNADRIVVLDKGRVAAEGSHKELMQSSPIYQEIFETQLGDGFALPEAIALPQTGALGQAGTAGKGVEHGKS
jgi:ATP-binding cassette subfamily B multidrug efflux pump